MKCSPMPIPQCRKHDATTGKSSTLQADRDKDVRVQLTPSLCVWKHEQPQGCCAPEGQTSARSKHLKDTLSCLLAKNTHVLRKSIYSQLAPLQQQRANAIASGLQVPSRHSVLSAAATGTRREMPRQASFWPMLAALACALGASASHAQALSFEEARTALLAKSDKLKAAEYNISKQEFEVMAVETLGFPELTLNATQLYGRKHFDLCAASSSRARPCRRRSTRWRC